MDRQTDPLTALLTQLTYQGLLDEYFHINFGYIYVDPELVCGAGEVKDKSSFKIPLDGDIFELCRDVNIKSLSSRLSNEITNIRAVMQAVKDDNDPERSIENMRKLERMQKRLQQTETHMNIGTEILKRMADNEQKQFFAVEQEILAGDLSQKIEEVVSSWVLDKQPLEKIYRILAIYSLVNQGIEDKVYFEIRKDIVESYGFEQLTTFNLLLKKGLITRRDKKSKEKSLFRRLEKELGLMRELPENVDPRLINLPYDKYVPLTYKLFEIAVTEGWRNSLVTDVIPGEVEVYGSLDNVIAAPDKRKVVLVYMIGGITYSEQAYMKKLADQVNIELIVAASNIIKSTDLTEQFIKTQPQQPQAEEDQPE